MELVEDHCNQLNMEDIPFFHRVSYTRGAARFLNHQQVLLMVQKSHPKKHPLVRETTTFNWLAGLTPSFFHQKLGCLTRRPFPEVPMQMIRLMDKTQNPTQRLVMVEAADRDEREIYHFTGYTYHMDPYQLPYQLLTLGIL